MRSSSYKLLLCAQAVFWTQNLLSLNLCTAGAWLLPVFKVPRSQPENRRTSAGYSIPNVIDSTCIAYRYSYCYCYFSLFDSVISPGWKTRTDKYKLLKKMPLSSSCGTYRQCGWRRDSQSEITFFCILIGLFCGNVIGKSWACTEYRCGAGESFERVCGTVPTHRTRVCKRICAQYHSSAGKIYKIYFSALSISLCLLNVFICSLRDEAQI